LPESETRNLTEAKAVSLAVNNPSLIRRPLIEHDDGSVTVGFSDKVKGFIG
jgi:arsenate reductase-like glutaredoxin family protein